MSDEQEREQAAKERCTGLYRHSVWPDADKDALETLQADLACMGMQVGWEACLAESPAVTALYEALADCAPSWLPPAIRAKRMSALKEFNKARGAE